MIGGLSVFLPMSLTQRIAQASSSSGVVLGSGGLTAARARAASLTFARRFS